MAKRPFNTRRKLARQRKRLKLEARRARKHSAAVERRLDRDGRRVDSALRGCADR